MRGKIRSGEEDPGVRYRRVKRYLFMRIPRGYQSMSRL